MNVRPRPEAGSQPDLNRHLFFENYLHFFLQQKINKNKNTTENAYRKVKKNAF